MSPPPNLLQNWGFDFPIERDIAMAAPVQEKSWKNIRLKKSVTSIKQTLMADHNSQLFPFGNHFCFHSNQPKSSTRFIPPETLEPKGIGLAIVDTLGDKQIENNGSFETSNNKVLFGTAKLKVTMELSEDYTCVKSHGPNPKTTHIYDNRVVKSCCNTLDEAECAPKSNYFLSFCHTCKKNLEQKIDIYIHSGEKAFCSQECRYQEMILHGEEK
ncbi:protein MARD1-like [Hibiscus syriacus]|uniref:protein MARD1-like n=1 Tax=Hibiscus syriacus TaxID=106335 RepID=UPI001924C88E|nr:protein MARD1-like [Hibiscus syriacus]